MSDDPTKGLSDAEREALDALRAAQLASRPSTGLEDRTVAALTAEGLIRPKRRSYAFQFTRVAAMAAAAVVVFVVGVNIGERSVNEAMTDRAAAPPEALEVGDEINAPEEKPAGARMATLEAEPPITGAAPEPELAGKAGRSSAGADPARSVMDDDDLVADNFDASVGTFEQKAEARDGDKVARVRGELEEDTRERLASENKGIVGEEITRAESSLDEAAPVKEEEFADRKNAPKRDQPAAAPVPESEAAPETATTLATESVRGGGAESEEPEELYAKRQSMPPSPDTEQKLYALLIYQSTDEDSRKPSAKDDTAQLYSQWELDLLTSGRLVERRTLGESTYRLDGKVKMKKQSDESASQEESFVRSQSPEDGRALIGYYIVTATSLHEARNLANSAPHLRFGAVVEVRPVTGDVAPQLKEKQ